MAINAPFGKITDVTIAATGTTALTIATQQVANLTLPTLTGNATLNLTISTQVKAGAVLYLKVKTTGTETFTFGTGFSAPLVTGVAGKTWAQGFWYDGTVYLPLGAKIQVD
jgi:hypothetical protein